jgi:PAS domain S-box-containing protein
MPTPPSTSPSTRSDQTATFQRFAQVIGVLVALGGSFVLATTSVEIPLLTRSAAGGAMPTSIAVAFVVAGASLWLVAGTSRLSWLASLLALVWGATALATVGSHVTRGLPPTTELCFAALATAVLASAVHSTLRLAHVLATSVALIAAVGCLAYLYNVRALYGISAYATMAPHTAFLLMLLAVGVLFARPHAGFMAVLISDGLGGMIARRLLPVAVMAPVLIAGLSLWAQRLGFYDAEFGASVFVLSMIVVLSVVIVWNARHLILLEADRRQAQKTLRLREAHMNAILDTSLDAVLSMDDAGRIVFWNRAAEAMFGWSRDEALGRQLAETIMPVEFRDPHRRGLQRFLATGAGTILGRRIEIVGLRRDGTEFPVELSVAALDFQGSHTFNAFIADITARKRVEEAVRVGEQHKSSLLRLARQLDQTSTLSGVVEAALEEVREVMGYGLLWAYLLSDDGGTASLIDAQGVTGVEPTRDFPVLSVAADRFLQEVFASRDVVVVEDAQVDPRTNKDVVTRLETRTIVCAPMLLANRRIGIVGTGSVRDEGVRLPSRSQVEYFAAMGSHVAVAFDRIRLVSERERAMEETRALNAELNARVIDRTQQLEAANRELEAFSYSVSHDLRAPLRHIDGFSKILLDDHAVALPPAAQRYLTLIRNGANTMGRMIDDLLHMARVDRREMIVKDTDLNEVVRNVIDELGGDVAGRAIDWEIEPLPVVACDPGLIKLVFINLLSNAVKYTRNRDRARIRVARHGTEEPPVVVVSDNGAGFDQRYADKLFGVFQRLHRTEDFEGTGIGLATVERIVQKHGGRVWAEAAVDQGATFYFTPGVSLARAAARQAEHLPQPSGSEDMPDGA